MSDGLEDDLSPRDQYRALVSELPISDRNKMILLGGIPKLKDDQVQADLARLRLRAASLPDALKL